MSLLHGYNRWPLRKKLLIVIGLASVPALLILLFFSLVRYRWALQRIRDESQAQVAAVKAQVRTRVEGVHHLLVALANSQEVQGQDRTACERYFRAIKSEFDAFRDIHALDIRGQVFASSDPNQLGRDRSKEDFFQRAMGQGQFVVGSFRAQSTSAFPTLHFALEIRDEQGRMLGVVVADFDMHRQDFIEEHLSNKPDSVVVITDPSGMVLYRNVKGERDNQEGLPDFGEAWDRTRRSDLTEAFSALGHDGIRRLYAVERLALNPGMAPDLFIRAGIPESLAFTPVRDATLWSVTGLLAALAAATAAAFLLEIGVLRDVRHLLAATKQLAAGDLGARTKMQGTAREMAELGMAFDQMAESLQRREQEHQLSEATARQAQKLESLGLLAGGIAHDFNNLITSLMGNLDLAELKISEDHSAQANLRAMREVLTRTAILTKQMLAYSGKGPVSLENLSLESEVRDMLNILQAGISKKIHIECQVAPNLPFIEGDRAQIQQIITNLITNAADAIGADSGRITIKLEPHRVKERSIHPGFGSQALDPGEYVTLVVEDTGMGMDAEMLPRIFDPFFTTKPHGHGLGLSALLGILKGHRGGVRVSSAPKAGTTFRVYIPASTHPPAPAPEPQVSQPWSFHGHILLVDDEPSLLLSTQEILLTVGFTVLTAKHGAEALTQFKAHHNDLSLVLMDITMPQMDGAEAFTHMYGIDPSVPVILTSGFSRQEMVGFTLGSQLAGFLQKPYSRHSLLNTLQKALQTWKDRHPSSASTGDHAT